MSKEFYDYKRRVISAAKDLHYDSLTINKLKAATNEEEIARIMTTTRTRMQGEGDYVKGYYINSVYMGYIVSIGKYWQFPSEEEYREYMREVEGNV